MRLARFCGVILVMLAIGSGSPALAQSYGSIRGYVRDEQGAALPGVIVIATSPTVAGTFTAVSDGEGYYRFLNLQPATYALTAELQGFAKLVRPDVITRAGLTLNIDITMKLGSLSETVEVTAEAPLLEAKTAVQAVNISGEFQRSLPLSVRRNWSDFLFLTPGVVTTEWVRQDHFFYVHGADFGSHVIQVDGADMAAPAQSSTVYVNMGNDALDDVQIKTGGADAASPLGVGAVISIATQSGTNRFSGSVATAGQRKDWTGNNNPGGTTSALSLFQQDLALGGPVVRDRIWFFGSYRYTRSKSGISRTSAQIANLRAIVPGFEPFDGEGEAHFGFIKGHTRLSSRHQLSGFYQFDQNPFKAGSAIGAALFGEDETGGYALSSRLSSVWGSSLSTRFAVSYNTKSFPGRSLRTDLPSRQVHTGTFLSSGRLQGTGAIALLDNQTISDFIQPADKLAITADATWYKQAWLGSHEIQSGFYLAPIWKIVFGAGYVNGGFVLEDVVLRNAADPSAGTIPFHRQIYDTDRYISTRVYSHDYAWYLQDHWKPSPRLTVSAGVRIDFIKRTDKLFDKVMQDSTEVGPRFGANYLLTTDGRNVVRASWGRVHDAVSLGSGTSAGSVSLGFRDVYDLDLNGSFETTFVTPPVTTLFANRFVDLENFHQPHIDEWILGYRRQLPGRMTVDASVVRRDYRDRNGFIDINPIYEDGRFVGYRDESLNDLLQITSNRYNWPAYTGLEFQVTKQTSWLQILGSYTRAFQSFDGTWQPNDPAQFIQPDAFENDRGIGSVRGARTDVNSLSGTHMTDNTQWRDHTVRIGASYIGPWDVIGAVSYTYQSGLWTGPIVLRLAAPDPQFGPPTLQLSNGRVVSNPLATTIRFAYPTRGEGQLRLDAMQMLNLRVGKIFRFGAQRLEVAVDGINMTNDDADQRFMTGANQQYNPNYGKGTFRIVPRTAQLSARFLF